MRLSLSNMNSYAYRARYFQKVDNVVTKVVLNRSANQDDEDIEEEEEAGWDVGMLIDKYAEEDQLNKALQEAKEAKQLYEKALKEKQDLEAEINARGEGLVGILRDKTNSLEDLLRMSRHTIATLQRKLKDTQQDYEATVASLDKQLKDLYEATGADENITTKDQSGNSGKETVSRAYDRFKAQAILEGKPEDQKNVSFKIETKRNGLV